jgi:nitrogen-specific signal transduction histidine kinase
MWVDELFHSSSSFLKKRQVNVEHNKDQAQNQADYFMSKDGGDSGILIIDNQGTVMRANRFIENILGYTSTELENRKLVDFVFEKSSNNANTSTATSWYGLHRNGTEIPLTLRWIDFESDHDSLVMVFILPMTETLEKNILKKRSSDQLQINEHLKKRFKKKAEQLEKMVSQLKKTIKDFQKQTQHRKHLETRLKRRKQLLHAVVRHFPDVSLFLLNERNELRSLKAPGKTSRKLPSAFFSAELMEELKKSFSGVITSTEVVNEENVYSVVASPFKDENGLIEYSLIIVRNISERKILESRISKVLVKEKEFDSLKAQSVMMNMLSHKLRTPLSTILAAVFLLENYSTTEFNQEKEVLMTKIRRAVQNMTVLLNELDVFNRDNEEKEAAGKEGRIEQKKQENSDTPFLHVIKNNNDNNSLSVPPQ